MISRYILIWVWQEIKIMPLPNKWPMEPGLNMYESMKVLKVVAHIKIYN